MLPRVDPGRFTINPNDETALRAFISNRLRNGYTEGSVEDLLCRDGGPSIETVRRLLVEVKVNARIASMKTQEDYDRYRDELKPRKFCDRKQERQCFHRTIRAIARKDDQERRKAEKRAAKTGEPMEEEEGVTVIKID